MAETLKFDFDAVTPRMLVDFKRETGIELMALVVGGSLDIATMPAEATAGLVWLAMRMSGNPDATYEEALDTPFTALEMDTEPDPETDPETDPTPASSTPS